MILPYLFFVFFYRRYLFSLSLSSLPFLVLTQTPTILVLLRVPFAHSSSFIVGLRVLLTLPGVTGFPARHRQESDRSEVCPSGIYPTIHIIWTYSRTTCSSGYIRFYPRPFFSPNLFLLPLSLLLPFVVAFFFLFVFYPASFTRPYRSQTVSGAGGPCFFFVFFFLFLRGGSPQSESPHAHTSRARPLLSSFFFQV